MNIVYVKPVKIHWRLGATTQNLLAYGGWGFHPQGGILDKLYVIFFVFLINLNNRYFAVSLNRKSSYCVAQCPGSKLRKWTRHLVYASLYSSEYNKDSILMFIMLQLRTVFLRLCII